MSGVGPQRIVTGRNGEVYYTPDLQDVRSGEKVSSVIVSSPFRYVEHPSQYHVENALLVVIHRGIGTKSALLNTLESLLAFPAYFGFNWDALFDCFRDLSWLSEHTIVLIHPELPMLPRPEIGDLSAIVARLRSGLASRRGSSFRCHIC